MINSKKKKQGSDVIIFLLRSFIVIFLCTLNSFFGENILNKAKNINYSAMVFFVPFIESFASFLYSFSNVFIFNKRKITKRIPDNFILCLVDGLLFSLCIFLSYASIKYISFPIKIILSSSKIVLAMPATIIQRNKKGSSEERTGIFFGYSLEELIVSLSICGGLVLMLYPSSGKEGIEKEFSWIGFFMMVLSINCNCFFDEIQNLLIEQTHESSVVLMWNMLISTIFFLGASIVTRTLPVAFSIIVENPSFIWEMIIMCILHVSSQGAIITLKQNHGIWWKNVVTSIRKCISVTLSIILFGHDVTVRQGIAIVFLFFCMFWAGSIEMKRVKKKTQSKDKSFII